MVNLVSLVSILLMPFGTSPSKMACASTVGVSLLGSLGEFGLLIEAILGIVAAWRCETAKRGTGEGQSAS
ncbi:hypothetical protein BDV11DRAFT_186559 [Aspergillus similis]